MKFYYFSAAWCAPCKAMKPLVEEYSEIEYVDVDTDEGSTIAGKFSVRGIPTLVAYDETTDKQIDVIVGSTSKSQLATFMEKHS